MLTFFELQTLNWYRGLTEIEKQVIAPFLYCDTELILTLDQLKRHLHSLDNQPLANSGDQFALRRG